MERYNKLFISLKYYLVGRRYHTALKCLTFARSYHTGTRKDGVSPELMHQVEIALYITTLKDIVDEELVLCAALLHDIVEDYNISLVEMEAKFGRELTQIVWLLTKKDRKIVKDPFQYFDEIAKDRVASIVKGADRIHNVQSMIGVFSTEKQKKYVQEVKDHFLPMIKRAKDNFPEQTAAYFNIENLLKVQIALIDAIHKTGKSS
jgi:(p)ppGpp synthase/HD superfamily hydrolase